MKDVKIVQGFESFGDPYQQLPYKRLTHVNAFFLMAQNPLVQVPAVSELHNQAETSGVLIEKCFFVGDYVRVVDTCEDSYFV